MGEAVVDYLSTSSTAWTTPPPRPPRAASSSRARSAAARRRWAATSTSCSSRCELAAAKTFEYAGPGYLAYIPGGGLYTAALAEFLAQGVNRYVEPVAALRRPWSQIEQNVDPLALRPVRRTPRPHAACSRPAARWRTSPRSSPRATRSSARTSWTARTTSASRRTRASRRPRTLAGFSRRNLRLVPTDPQLRMDADALRDMVARGPRGRPPAVPGGAVGRHDEHRRDRPARTTSPTSRPRTGCGCTSTRAYGGFFQLTERGRERFRGIERADSRHARSAQGAVPAVRDRVARGARRRGAPRRALRGRRVPAGPRAPRASCRTSPSTRPSSRGDFRGLRVWMPLKLHGVGGVPRGARREARPHRSPPRRAPADPASSRCPWEPQLTVVPFRLARRRRRRRTAGSWT